MINKVVILILAGAMSVGAKLWVNAVRDPGAELGQGDWKTDTYELPAGYGLLDSARVSEHDSSRAYEGKFSFLTDTKKDPKTVKGQIRVWCYQELKVPKAVKDLDSCEWIYYIDTTNSTGIFHFDISFRTRGGRTLLCYSGSSVNEEQNDTLYPLRMSMFPTKQWLTWGVNLKIKWVNQANWSEDDTISEVMVRSRGGKDIYWGGQDVSWDNIYLASVAYYDYAAKSIDSDSLADKSYTPQVTFANEGIKADKDAWVYAEILEGTTRVYIDSQQVSIPKESSQQITFKTWTVPHTGPYTLRAYPILELDELSSDDTLEKPLTGTGIEEQSSPQGLSLQIEGVLRVRYSLPLGEQGTITLYDPTGRRVESLKVQGSGSVGLKSKLASGVYFVKLETEKTCVMKKAVNLH